MNVHHLKVRHEKEAIHVKLQTQKNYSQNFHDSQTGMMLADLSTPVVDGFERG